MTAQVCFEIPSIECQIPNPLYQIGQWVNVKSSHWCDLGVESGRIAGATFYSREVAAKIGNYPGWSYSVELPVFESREAMIDIHEEDIEILESIAA